MEVFYLKFNRDNSWVTARYANIWLDIIREVKDAYVYFIVDKDSLSKHLQKMCNFHDIPHEFIKSQRDSAELQSIVKKAFTPNWHNAGYAHLTTFLHARDHGYENFWNIDGDDSAFFAEPTKLAKLFHEVKCYAKLNNLDALSFDYWCTFAKWAHFTFGVAYVDNYLNWLDLMTQYAERSAKNVKNDAGRNVDLFLLWLSGIRILKLGAFYCENLYAILNNVGDPYLLPTMGSLRYWHEGKVYFPTVIHDLAMGDAGVLDIPKDMIKFDVGISSAEGLNRIRSIASLKNFTPPPSHRNRKKPQRCLQTLATIFCRNNILKSKSTLR